ncbi:hypothetical protein, partial [Roseitranquillus sediminis]|uniref:hypothetical protein n=1 Tax=Roseitranquillus sediminis TaxID=2809051 RepID=UPI001D0CA4FD
MLISIGIGLSASTQGKGGPKKPGPKVDPIVQATAPRLDALDDGMPLGEAYVPGTYSHGSGPATVVAHDFAPAHERAVGGTSYTVTETVRAADGLEQRFTSAATIARHPITGTESPRLGVLAEQQSPEAAFTAGVYSHPSGIAGTATVYLVDGSPAEAGFVLSAGQTVQARQDVTASDGTSASFWT